MKDSETPSRILEDYNILEQALDAERIHLKFPGMNFREICSHLGVCPFSLDFFIHEELGLSGQELIDRYRFLDKQKL